jgi:hypothetical protein
MFENLKLWFLEFEKRNKQTNKKHTNKQTNKNRMTTKFDIGFGKVMKKYDDTFVLNCDHNFKRF